MARKPPKPPASVLVPLTRSDISLNGYDQVLELQRRVASAKLGRSGFMAVAGGTMARPVRRVVITTYSD